MQKKAKTKEAKEERGEKEKERAKEDIQDVEDFKLHPRRVPMSSSDVLERPRRAIPGNGILAEIAGRHFPGQATLSRQEL